MSLADMAMVSRLGANALAATGMGSLLLWVIMSMGIGLRAAVQTVSARRLGQKKYPECGNALYNGTILACVVAIPFTLIGITYVTEIANYFLEDIAVISHCIDYLFVGFFGILFVLTGFAFQGFYAGVEQTRIHMHVTIVSNILNVYLNAGFIYGSDRITDFFAEMGILWFAGLWNWAPFPALAVKGAAIATLIASIWMVIHYALYLFNEQIKVFHPFNFRNTFVIADVILLSTVFNIASATLSVNGFGKSASSVKFFLYL